MDRLKVLLALPGVLHALAMTASAEIAERATDHAFWGKVLAGSIYMAIMSVVIAALGALLAPPLGFGDRLIADFGGMFLLCFSGGVMLVAFLAAIHDTDGRN